MGLALRGGRRLSRVSRHGTGRALLTADIRSSRNALIRSCLEERPDTCPIVLRPLIPSGAT
jgi:hypothetical protein